MPDHSTPPLTLQHEPVERRLCHTAHGPLLFARTTSLPRAMPHFWVTLQHQDIPPASVQSILRYTNAFAAKSTRASTHARL
ncbi:hypothetical protein PsYK624_164300 [Phanerochaete sordida]|uniref:Uncharacterized protein n=1 Tax=Phanerochaete sordida TaxID=48140 RepID=A0A9P3LM83_9APHY|nr:hypothetical protein PsYK624_164300 [Phanerochaete sordida]